MTRLSWQLIAILQLTMMNNQLINCTFDQSIVQLNVLYVLVLLIASLQRQTRGSNLLCRQWQMHAHTHTHQEKTQQRSLCTM